MGQAETLRGFRSRCRRPIAGGQAPSKNPENESPPTAALGLRITTGTGRIAGTVNVNNASAGLQLFGSTLNLDSPIAIQGATVLGENDRYAASTGFAQINLAANGADLPP